MKKLLTLTAIGAILTAPAVAVQKCVALNDTTTCTYENPGSGVTNWAATCTTNGTKVRVHGVAVCAGSDDVFLEYLDYDFNPNGNEYCWCRMIYPFASYYWVYVGEQYEAASCFSECASRCSYAMGNSIFRKSLFMDLNEMENL